MSFKEITDFLTNPSVTAGIGAILSFVFTMLKIAPNRKVKKSIELIDTYAPIIFNAVEEMALTAKKQGDVESAKIDKAMEYEKRIRALIQLYNGMINDAIIDYAHVQAKAINLQNKQS